jgi:hypothetical protein
MIRQRSREKEKSKVIVVSMTISKNIIGVVAMMVSKSKYGRCC